MSTETEIAEVQAEEKASPKSTQKDNEYKIFDYFKEHTGLLVTCVSALVAIISFILHFAVGRMNYAYLEYWDIASLHANANNQNEIYTVACMLLYIASLLVIQSLIGKTADTFKHYNQLLSTINQGINISKRLNKQLRRKLRGITNDWDKLLSKEKKSRRGKRIKEQIDDDYEILKKGEQSLKNIKKARNKLLAWVVIQIVVAVILSYLLGCLSLFLVNMTTTISDSFQSSHTIVTMLVGNLLIYFVPAYFASRCRKKQYEDEAILERMLELANATAPDFPFESLMKEGVKSLFSDKKLKLASIQMVIVIVILLSSMSLTGTQTAERKNSFPIYTDGDVSYAIVYFRGTTVFMEKAIEQDDAIVIDTTKQRIVTKDDLSYDIKVFENVEIIRNNNEQNNNEKRELTVRDVVDAVGAFLERIKSKIGEAMVENEGSISGTE